MFCGVYVSFDFDEENEVNIYSQVLFFLDKRYISIYLIILQPQSTYNLERRGTRCKHVFLAVLWALQNEDIIYIARLINA